MYDTDTRVNYSTEPTKIKTPLGSIPALNHIASMETLVKTGWRIYSPSDRAILDEFIVGESIVFAGKGINPVAAVAGMMNRKEAVKEVSSKAGHIYALRLIPIPSQGDTRLLRQGHWQLQDRKTACTAGQMGRCSRTVAAGDHKPEDERSPEGLIITWLLSAR
jgi:hypothetical protein